jgi:predicted membrane-bound mannosyltransferase
MSSTPVRRTGPSSRSARPARTIPSLAPPPAPTVKRWEGERTYASPLARAFPAVRIDADTIALILIVAFSLAIRLIGLGDRPLHHDESLHSEYAWYLMGSTNPNYYYDPLMHGPLQFHMMAFFYSIFGSSVFTARLWSVTAGTALVAVPWLLRRQLGRWQVFALMGILSVSPIVLYFSRFAREDMQFALFTFLMIASLIRYIADRQDGNMYHYRWLYVFGLSTGLAYAAKESVFLSVTILGMFLIGALTIELLRGPALGDRLRGITIGPAWRRLWIRMSIRLGIGGAFALLGVGSNHLIITEVAALALAAMLIVQIAVSLCSGPVSDAIRDTPGSAWALAGCTFVALFIMLYWPIGHPASWAFIPGSNMESSPLDIPGKATPQPFSYSTDGLTGGLLYWQAQQAVARGGQPWFYYFLVIPMYEWLVVLFGVVGGLYVAIKRRTMATMMVLWWTVASWMIYGWTSEKMPWNALHLVVPLAVLAAIGLVAAVTAARPWIRYTAIVAALITGFFSTHNAVTLAYVTSGNPVEYMVYVQTSPDVPKVFNEMQLIQSHLNGPLHMQIDSANQWPWVFYVRDNTKFWDDAIPATAAAYGAADQPVLLVGPDDYPDLSSSLGSRYVAFHEDLRWWNPEEYKGAYVDRYKWVDSKNPSKSCADPTHLKCQSVLESRVERLGDFVGDLFSPSSWSRIMQWEIQRTPFTPHAWDNWGDQTDFWFLVRKDMVQYMSPGMQAQAQTLIKQQVQQNPFLTLGKTIQPTQKIASGSKTFTSVGPIAVDAKGNIFAGDLKTQRIVELSPAGKVERFWGTPGSGPGQFNGKFAPSIGGIAAAANGNVYATDTWNGRVEEFSPEGKFIRAWGQQNLAQDSLKPDDFYGPRGIAVGPTGDVYVADTGHKRVQVFDATGHFVRSVGQAGPANGQFDEPSSVAIDKHGTMIVADFWNSRIETFNAAGVFQSTFQVTAWQSGGYDEPQIAVDSTDRIYAPDPSGSRILVYTSAGVPQYAWGSVGTAAGQFTKPTGVVVGPGGTILVSDPGNVWIQSFPAR